MKKKFVEPEIVRIDVKMTENIAASKVEGDINFYAGGDGTSIMLYARIYGSTCFKYMVESSYVIPKQDHIVHWDEALIAQANNCMK